ncbi:MAG: diguanylate cyclase [Nitrospirae bacterium]|nr:diguanylate cyclase [Nitrospirota bacterium]
MKVLVADTSASTRKELGPILENEGYLCCFTKRGSDIIECVYRESPDVVFLPTNSHYQQSLKILVKLKSAPSTRDIPVILIAANRARKTLAKGFQLGAYDYISPPYFKEEVLARIRNIIHIRNKTKELEFMMDRDYLTGLYNRNYFMARLIEELSWSMSYKEPLSLMMLDIDFFKKVNDTYGHRCGDEVLRKIADCLSSTARREDIVGRYGGEEFIILMSNASLDDALVLGEKLRKAVMSEKFSLELPNMFSVTISIGITTFTDINEQSTDVLIGQADKALYAAKEGGRNRICVYGK